MSSSSANRARGGSSASDGRDDDNDDAAIGHSSSTIGDDRANPSLEPPSSRLSSPCYSRFRSNQLLATMLSDSPNKVFLGSCEEVHARRLVESPILVATPISHFPIAYQSDKLCPAEDEVVSNAERLSAFYPNATYDFYGTPSCALSVYKNGDAWPVRTGPEAWRIIREARPVYDHPMQATWHAVGEHICTLLDDKKILWTSIDPLAFAEARKKTFSPLLLWIGVEPASLHYEDANTAAEAIMFFLAEAGFGGIEIGFRESIVTCSVSWAGPKMLSFNPFYDPIPSLHKPFTPTLGLSIAPLKTPYFEGTGALYFRESKESDRVFLLTCAHVAHPTPTHYCAGLSHKTKGHPHEKVIALGSVGYIGAVQSMMITISKQYDLINCWEDELHRLGEPKKEEEEEITKKRKMDLILVKNAKKTIDEADKFHSEITKYWTTPDQRIIGKVAHVEPIGVATKPHYYTRDWAFIELCNNKFDWANFKGNKVFVGGNISLVDYMMIMFPNLEDRANCKYPLDGLLQVSGVVQPHEIHIPQHLDANGEKCLLVVKNGLGTGTTIGRVMGMESFTRRYKEYGIKETSIEIAVLPYGNKDGPFSAPGDSGSIALNRDGHILGMLTGGAGTSDKTDITYLTPYWYIEEEIKRVFPDCHLYEVVE